MGNPFTLSFGKKPSEFISRITQTNQILDDFKGENPSSQVYMITGVRGAGKTVMMTTIASMLTQDKQWISVELNPERDMLDKLAASLYSIPDLHALFLKAKLDFSALGLGVTLENSAPVNDIEIAIDKMLEHVKKSGKKILITIDEVTKNDNIRVFSAAFQILLRKEYPVYLLMTGLYENIYNLQNEKSLTFLYRAPKVVLEPLNYTAMIAKYKQVFSCEQEKAEEMATSHKTDVTLIREALGMSTSKFSVYRDRLKRKGIVNASQYGSLFLILPRFEDFIKLHLE